MSAPLRPPPIILGQTDADRIAALVRPLETTQPQLADLLLGEIERADIRPDAAVPANTVTMDAFVEFLDEAHGATRTVQLVYPSQADIAANRISVLTPIGAGLIGLSEGQSIIWPDRAGRERPLKIICVRKDPAV